MSTGRKFQWNIVKDGIECTNTPRWLILEAGLEPPSKSLFGILATFADADGKVENITKSELAEFLGAESKQKIQRYLKKLVAAKALFIAPNYAPSGARVASTYYLAGAEPFSDEDLDSFAAAEMRKLLPVAKSKNSRRPAIHSNLRKKVFERDAYRCVKCQSWKDLTIDHIYPRILGGKDIFENFQTLCRLCNSAKGSDC